MKVYHYTRDTLWDEIVRGSDKGRGKPGLAATKRMGKYDQEAWETCSVFAFLAPLPSFWIDNPYFKDSWKYLKSDIGNVLLEISVDPEMDNAYVVDFGHKEGFYYQDKTGIPERYLHGTQREAERAYMLSRVHIGDYLQSGEFNYSLPEVIIPQHVPLDRISVSLQQPILELRLALKETKRVTADSIVNGPMKKELIPWRQTYEETHGLLQDLIEPKEDIIEILNRMNGEFNNRTGTIGHERTSR